MNDLQRDQAPSYCYLYILLIFTDTHNNHQILKRKNTALQWCKTLSEALEDNSLSK